MPPDDSHRIELDDLQADTDQADRRGVPLEDYMRWKVLTAAAVVVARGR